MKIVIDIPDADYNIILANANFYKEKHWGVAEVWDAIVKGTPLPKGHGDLIDRDEVLMHERCKFSGDCPMSGGTPCATCGDNYVEVAEIVKATTIIPADDSVDNSEVD